MLGGKKKGRKSHTGPLSHFYGNLKAIIVPCHSLWKGFSWRGAGRGGERGGRRAAFSLLTAGKQTEEEWMSKRKTPLCGVIQQKSAATHRVTLLMWGIFSVLTHDWLHVEPTAVHSVTAAFSDALLRTRAAEHKRNWTLIWNWFVKRYLWVYSLRYTEQHDALCSFIDFKFRILNLHNINVVIYSITE